jgi:hypothetical protein
MDEMQDQAQPQAENVDNQPDQGVVENSQPQQEAGSFYDVDQVPEELRPVYDRMQADYTRKRQREREELNELRGQVEKFSGIMNDPEKLKAYAAAMGVEQREGGDQPSTQPNPLAEHPGRNYDEVLQEEVIQPIDYMIRDRFEELAKPYIEQVNKQLQVLDNIKREKTVEQWNQLKSKYPVIGDYEEDPRAIGEIDRLMASGLSMEKAVFAYAGNEILDHQQKSLLREPASERAAGTTPLTQGGAPMRGTKPASSSRDRLLDLVKAGRAKLEGR